MATAEKRHKQSDCELCNAKIVIVRIEQHMTTWIAF